MRNSEKCQIASDAIKGGTVTGAAAVALGLASVKTTIFFGLIVTGSVVSWPLVGAWALGGALTSGAGTFGSIKLRHHLIKKEFSRLAQAEK